MKLKEIRFGIECSICDMAKDTVLGFDHDDKRLYLCRDCVTNMLDKFESVKMVVVQMDKDMTVLCKNEPANIASPKIDPKLNYMREVYVAIHNDNIDYLLYLIEENPECIYMADEDGVTSLMNAVAFGRFDMVRLLVEKGVNIFAVDIREKTAFNYATEHKQSDIENYLYNKMLSTSDKELLEKEFLQ